MLTILSTDEVENNLNRKPAADVNFDGKRLTKPRLCQPFQHSDEGSDTAPPPSRGPLRDSSRMAGVENGGSSVNLLSFNVVRAPNIASRAAAPPDNQSNHRSHGLTLASLSVYDDDNKGNGGSGKSGATGSDSDGNSSSKGTLKRMVAHSDTLYTHHFSSLIIPLVCFLLLFR